MSNIKYNQHTGLFGYFKFYCGWIFVYSLSHYQHMQICRRKIIVTPNISFLCFNNKFKGSLIQISYTTGFLAFNWLLVNSTVPL